MAAIVPVLAPSKVIHIRNLVEGVTEHEITAICSAYGPVAQVMVNVGKDRNQAFVQFMDINSAVGMVTHHSTTNEPLMVRGKPAYIQYSNRHEIVGNPRDNPSKVLLVTMDSAVARSITVDILHALFSRFGFVEKIATFDKGQGLQALIQFDGPLTAQTARDTLDGQPVPQYLAPTAPPLPMRMNFSSHNDITVKFQSHKSRDYTNPYLPVAHNATDIPQASIAPILSPSAMHTQPEANVLLCAIDNAAYPMTVDPLHTVFSKYGTVEKIAVFDKNGATQALVQYADVASATSAKIALEGHAIFEGGYNKLRISTSIHKDLTIRENTEKTWDYTEGKGSALANTGGANGASTNSTDPSITGIEFEQAHEQVVKLAQQAMAGQIVPGGGMQVSQVTPLMLQQQQPQLHQHSVQPLGMLPQAPTEGFAYLQSPGMFGAAHMPRPHY